MQPEPLDAPWQGPDETDLVTPEDLTAEERLAGDVAREFLAREVLTRRPALEQHDWQALRQLLGRAGELGLLGAGVPEPYGGLGIRQRGQLPILEALGRDLSFATTCGAQAGIGLLPILYFGTPQQKERYLPKLASGQAVAAYALTEPDAGSDAMAVRTVARREGDGYVLRGRKQWITNAGLADVFVVYGKVDGRWMTAFLVERAQPGVQVGPEARKMGLNGSSTADLLLEDVHVPDAALLHRVGEGHRVALNTLNLGRFRLAASCLGACRHLLELAAAYTRQRHQFGRPLCEFALVQAKLARMAVGTYAVESAVYRVAGLLERVTARLDLVGDAREASAAHLAEVGAECAIVKVLGSEVLDRVVDDALQLHGGYGYMRDYEVERIYRDSRIHRIFEGTNEIQRLLIARSLLRRLERTGPPSAPGGLPPEVPATGGRAAVPPEPLLRARWQVDVLRRQWVWLAVRAAQRYGDTLADEQELAAVLADLSIGLWAAESGVARAWRLAGRGAPGAAASTELACALVEAVRWQAREQSEMVAPALGTETAGPPEPARAEALWDLQGPDRIRLHRSIARRVLEAGGYPLADRLLGQG